MYVAVKKVVPLDNYQLLLTFENEEKRQFNMKPYLDTGLFKELKNIDLFKTARVSFDTVEWENEIDIDPEVLYSDSIKI